MTGMDFVAKLNNYNITVEVRNMEAGDKVTLPALNGSLPTQSSGSTGENGVYVYTLPALGSYSITPVSNKWNFTSSSAAFTNLIGNKSVIFTASGRKQYTISGNGKEKKCR